MSSDYFFKPNPYGNNRKYRKKGQSLESHFRTILKTLSWRLVATGVTFLVAWLLTGRIAVAAGIGLSDTFIKLFAYYVHERAWNRVQFGKVKPVEYQI